MNIRAFLAIFCLTPLPVAAQTARDILLQSQQHQWTISVVAGPDTTQSGTVTRLTTDSVSVGHSSLLISSITEIAQIRRQGGGGGPAALAGAGMLAALGIVVETEFCRPKCSFRELAGGIAVGGTVGATLGGLIGGAAKPSKRVRLRLWPTS